MSVCLSVWGGGGGGGGDWKSSRICQEFKKMKLIEVMGFEDNREI